MADPVLHIKDSYYFEVPKFLAPAAYKDRTQFPQDWGKLDPQFQDWEFEKMYHSLASICPDIPAEEGLHHDWKHWQHDDHANFAKPFDTYLAEARQSHLAAFEAWKVERLASVDAKDKATESAKLVRMTVDEYLKNEKLLEAHKIPQPNLAWFTACMEDGARLRQWTAVTQNEKMGHDKYWDQYLDDTSAAAWSPAKVAAYNEHLSGKILIRQPFGTLRNMYERESGFTISKFVLIEIGIGLALILIFSAIANRLRVGGVPRGKFWNLFEVFLLFIRDQVARPAIGAHHDEHDDHHGSHDDHPAHVDANGHVVEEDVPHHAHAPAHGSHSQWAQADSFVPLLWTIFFFVLFCNLSGMIPWLGAPTGSWSVTMALAMATFSVVVIAGVKQFGVLGFFVNQVPSMDLPLPIAIVLKPMIFAIEILGLLIKHLVLSIRLLANMVAGHLVILAFLGMAFGAEAALRFTNESGAVGWTWYLTAVVSIVGVTCINLLELMVAFLQAYIFTFLSALFIGASVHKH